MKAANYEMIQARASCPDMLKQKILGNIETDFKTSAMKEEPVAMKCGFRYQMIFTDRTLYGKAVDYFMNDSFIDTQICDGCRTPPARPGDYDIKPNDVTVTQLGFTRFWLDSDGALQSVHMDGDVL